MTFKYLLLIVFSREEHNNWLSNTKWAALKTCIRVTLFRLRRLYLGIYTYIHSNKKEAVNLKESKEGLCRRVRGRNEGVEMI